MPWPASARHVAPAAVCAVVVILAAGCGSEAPPAPNNASTAEVGPECAALRASKDPEYNAFVPLIDVVYRGDPEGEAARFDSLTPGQRMFLATKILENEIDNGGLNQYFFNTEGATLETAIRGYEVFGSPGLAKLARQAAEIYAEDKERIAKAKDDGTLEAFSESYKDEPYERLDTRYVELGPPAGRLAYLRTHLREFCVP